MVGLWALFSLGYVFGPFGPGSPSWFANLGTVLAAWTAALLAVAIWRSHEPDEPLTRIWRFLAAGFSLWAIGETLWAYFDLRLGGELPYPSLADAAWVAGYPLVWIGLRLRYRSLEVPTGRHQWLALAAIGVVGVVVFGAVLWPILATPDAGRPIELALNVYYPVAGFVLFGVSVLVASALRGGRLSTPWQAIAIGTAVLSLADLTFAYATWHDLYSVEGLPNLITILTDVPYMGAYTAIVLGEHTLGRLEGAFGRSDA